MQDPDEKTAEDLDLEYVRDIRRGLIGKLYADDKLSEDKGKLGALTTLMADMDRASLGRKRIQTDNAAAGAVSMAMAIIDQLNHQEAFRRNDRVTGERQELPGLPPPDDDVVFISGQLDTTPTHETYQSFMTRMVDESNASASGNKS